MMDEESLQLYSDIDQSCSLHCMEFGIYSGTEAYQWRIQDFPEGVGQPRRWSPIYYLANFCQKLNENEEI